MQLICDDMWLNGYTWMEDDVFHEFNPAKFKYTLPKYLDYNRFEIDTWLSARMMSSLVTQLSGKLRAICTRLCPPKVLLADKNGQNWLKQHLTRRPHKLLYLY